MSSPLAAALLIVFCAAISLHSSSPVGIFRDVSAQANVNFLHDPLVGGKYFFPEVMGSGCALFDYDNDGYLDLYLISPGKNRLFRQNASFAFEDVTQQSGLRDPGYGMGVAVGDFNNDGYPDIFDSNYGKDRLFKNNGNGTFSDITDHAGINTDGWSTSAAFFDYDRDGFLDLYIARYVKLDPSVICTDRAGRKDYCGPEGYEAEADLLYHNRGNGTFENVSTRAGINRFPMKGLGVIAADFNNDGFSDLYVANDRQPNHLWINQHDGTFRDAGLALGASVNAMGQPEASMGVAAGDYDNDGFADVFVTNLRDETNTLYRNAGANGFRDESSASNLGGPSIPYTGFGAAFFDYDNDGWLDVAAVNGRVTRGPLLTASRPPKYWDAYAEPNLLFRNAGNGKFVNASANAGEFSSLIENHRGLALGDIDNDGSVDLLITTCGGQARVFRNENGSKSHWLLIRAYDPALKRDAIGARVIVTATGRRLVRSVQPSGSYLSSNDPRVHFGLGTAMRVDSVEIDWPDGSKESFKDISADRIITLEKGKAQ